MVREDGVTLAGGHTMQCIDHISVMYTWNLHDHIRVPPSAWVPEWENMNQNPQLAFDIYAVGVRNNLCKV